MVSVRVRVGVGGTFSGVGLFQSWVSRDHIMTLMFPFFVINSFNFLFVLPKIKGEGWGHEKKNMRK
jgi:hypothetical protein